MNPGRKPSYDALMRAHCSVSHRRQPLNRRDHCAVPIGRERSRGVGCALGRSSAMLPFVGWRLLFAGALHTRQRPHSHGRAASSSTVVHQRATKYFKEPAGLGRLG